MLAMVLHGMQGTPYIYQGEEIGMTNPHFSSISDYRDVESHNMFIERAAQGQSPDELLAILASKSRDNSRTPMPWHAARTVASATVNRGSALAITTGDQRRGGAGGPRFGVLCLSAADYAA
jgi:glycosidase